MKSPTRWLLLTLAAAFLAGTTGLDAKTKTLHYPTEDESMFFITAPADWEVTGIDEVGEFGSIESENGSILQFRAVECETEEEFMAEMASITESTIETLEENYSDVALGEVKELDVNGRRGFQLSGEGKDEDGNPVQFGSFTIILGPTTIAEIWAAAYPEDKAVAEAVLSSFTPTGAPAGSLNLDFELVNKTGKRIKGVYMSPSDVESWQDNVLSEPMANGTSLEINFSPNSDAEIWDLKIVWAGEGEDVVWTGFNLAEISKLTLTYDADTDETSAESE